MQDSARAQRLEPDSFVLSDSSQQRSQHQISYEQRRRRIEGKEVAPGRGAAERVGKGGDPSEERYDGGGAEALRLRLLRGRPMEAGRALVARLLRIGRIFYQKRVEESHLTRNAKGVTIPRGKLVAVRKLLPTHAPSGEPEELE